MIAYKIQFANDRNWLAPRYFRHLLDATKAVGLERKYQAIRRKLIKAGFCEVEGVVFERIKIQ